jgi:hypothetical protein
MLLLFHGVQKALPKAGLLQVSNVFTPPLAETGTGFFKQQLRWVENKLVKEQEDARMIVACCNG